MSEGKKLVPKLRFPDFQMAGDWTTAKLGSLASISTEKVGNADCVPMSITSGVGLVSQEDKFGRVIAGDSYKNYLLLKPNDFAYNKSATKEYPEGFLALYSGSKLAAVPNSIFTCFRVNGDSPVPKYLNYLFLGNLHGQWLRKFIQVGARAHGSLSINDGDLLALPVPLPAGESSVAEQQKIADCLSSLDELIAAQASQSGCTQDPQEGLMQQLFPREGEMQPRVRFPGFFNDWALAKIGDYIESYKGGASFAPSDFSPYSEYEVIPKKAIGAGGWLRGNTEKPTYCTEDFYNKNLQAVVDNSYLITTLRDLVPSGPSIGYIVKYSSEELYILAQGVYGLKPKDGIISDFIIQFSNTDKYRKIDAIRDGWKYPGARQK